MEKEKDALHHHKKRLEALKKYNETLENKPKKRTVKKSKKLPQNRLLKFIITYSQTIWFLLLFLSFLGITFYHANNDFITSDEVAHIAAAESYLSGEGLNWEHPPMQKFVNSLFIRAFLPNLEFDGPPQDGQNQFARGAELYFDGQYKPQTYLLVSRISYIFFNCLLFVWILIYGWIYKLIPKKLLLIFTTIFVFSSSLVTHAHLATYDVAGSVSIFLTVINLLLLIYNFRYFKFKQKLIHTIIFGFLLSFSLMTKFSNLLLLPVLALIFGLALAYCLLHKKFKRFFQALGYSVLAVIIPFLLIGGIYQYGFYDKNYDFYYNDIVAGENRIYRTYANFNQDFEESNPQLYQRAIPWLWYGDGAMATLARSLDEQAPFLYGDYRQVSFGQYVFNVFWFKENPVLYILLLLSLIMGIYYLLLFINYELAHKEILISFFRKNFWFSLYFAASFVAFLVLYTTYSWNKPLVIGYRHFYPGLIFIYALIAYGLYKFYDQKKLAWLVPVSLIYYVILGLFAIPQSITYTNFFWQQDKYLLTNDSTINWAQDHGAAYRYLLDQGAINDETKTKIASYIFTLSLAPDKIVRVEGGPNYPELGRYGNVYQFPIDQIPIQNTPWEYLVVDSNFFQQALKLSQTSSIAKQNYEYVTGLTPVYSKNDVIFVYKLK